MSKTSAELATRVLRRLNVIGAGETPDADLSSEVIGFYAGIFKEQTRLGVFYWDQDDIPDEAFEAAVDLIAGLMGTDYGAPRPDLQQSGDLRTRILGARGGTGRRVTGEFF
jgi:hypothetical protein